MVMADARWRRIAVLAATALGVLLTAGLGLWQLDRAAVEILGAVQGYGRADASPPPAAHLTDAPTTEIETAPVRACEGRPRLLGPGI